MHVSGLIGLLVLLNQLWRFAPIEHAILRSIGVGLSIYLLLVLGYTIVLYYQKVAPRIQPPAPPAEPAPSEDETTDETASAGEASGAAASPARARGKEPSGEAAPASSESSSALAV